MADLARALALGIPATLAVTLLSFALGLLGAIPLLLMSRSRFALARWAARLVIDLLRGIPPIVWLFIIYFGLGAGAVKLDAFQAGVLGLGLIASAYLAEIMRGAISGVHSGQWEAARALGMSRFSVFWLIIVPQAARIALPAVATYLIGLLKDSSFVSTIGVMDILFHATALARTSGAGLVPYFTAGLLYIVLSLPIAWLAKVVDARLRPRVAR